MTQVEITGVAVVAMAHGRAAAWTLAKLSTSILYRVPPDDLATFTRRRLFLAAIALLAGGLPSRRTAGTEPLIAPPLPIADSFAGLHPRCVEARLAVCGTAAV